MKAKIIFDEGHKNVTTLCSEADAERSFSKLVEILGSETSFELGESITGEITPVSLHGCQVFVLAAPTHRLTLDEINYIWWFVRDGGGLLLLNNAEAVRSQLFSLNELAGRAGCRFGYYAAHEPEVLTGFAPHYITGSVETGRVKKNISDERVCSRVELVTGGIELQSICQNTYSQLLAVGSFGRGRVVVAGNTAMFSNKYIELPDNRRLALNIFKWLAKDNPFEIINWTRKQNVELGHRYAFELALGNPTSRLTKIASLSLETSVNDIISQSSTEEVILYPSKDSEDIQRFRWEIKPQKILGDRVIRLRITCEQDEAVYRQTSGFSVVVPGHTRLKVVKSGEARQNIVVGEPFDVIGAGSVTGLQERSVSFTPELTHPPELRQVDQAWPASLKWTFTADRPGTYPIALRVKETGQSVETHVVVEESIANQIEEITTEYIEPLDDEIRRILPKISSALAVPEVAQVRFRLLPVEDYIRAAFPFGPAAQKVRDVVDAGYLDEMENDLVVADLLFNLAPMYTPRAGASVPFAPDLVSLLIERGSSRRKELLTNFLKGNHADTVELRRRIAAYLSHEKYGHGFFYTCTKLGQQLAVLDKHLFLDKHASELLDEPYPSKLYNKYKTAIIALQHSALIANEGFAAWLELHILRQMSPDIHAIIPEREEFMRASETLKDLRRTSPYFRRFPPPPNHDSPYEEGRYLLDGIEHLFPPYEVYGVRCAVQAFLVATTIPLGITDEEDEEDEENEENAPEFRMEHSELQMVLLGEEEGHARSELRLWRIGRLLEDSQKTVQAAQHQLQCHASCPHPECPVRAQIAQKLGWR